MKTDENSKNHLLYCADFKSIIISIDMSFSLFRQPTDYREREHAMSTCGLDLILCPGLGFTEKGKL